MHPTKSAEAKIDPLLESQFAAGRLYASISSRPGQSGRADGYILEGKELEVNTILKISRISTYMIAVLRKKVEECQAKARPCLIFRLDLYLHFVRENCGLKITFVHALPGFMTMFLTEYMS